LFGVLKGGESQGHRIEAFATTARVSNAEGKKIIVCLHHSPFEGKDSHYLRDSARFLRIIQQKVDCLLFGHLTPEGVFQQPRPTGEDGDFHEKETGIPLINCENLEKMNYVGDGKRHLSYPVTVLDLETDSRLVFQTDGSGVEGPSPGNLPRRGP
jgi:hypothetical protein